MHKSGVAALTVTVSASQAQGTYKLAQGAENFAGSITIGDGTVNYGAVTVNGSTVEYNGTVYALKQSDGNLTLDIENTVVPAPDLCIQDYEVSGTSVGKSGSVKLSFKYTNKGTGNAGASVLKVYDGNTLLRTFSMGSVAAGSFRNASVTLKGSELGTGARKLFLVVDANKQITESNEDNNKAYRTVTVNNLPDLRILDYEVSSTSISKDGSVKLSFKYANTGSIAAGSSVLKVYDGNTLLRTFTMGSVAADSHRPATVTLKGSELGNGARKIFLVVDANNQVTEFNEANNKAYRTITVKNSADLCIKNYEISTTTVDHDGTVKLTFQYANTGVVEAGSSVLKVYDGNTLLRTFTMGSVAAGSFRNGTVTLKGSELASGSRNIYLVADANNQITEFNEDNNKAYRTVTVNSTPDGKSDLCIQDYSLSSSSITPDDTLKLTFKYANTGSESAGASILKVYDGNTLLRTFTMGSVEAGSFRNGTVTLKGSELASGSRNIYLVADADKQISESNEDNNKAYRTVNVEQALESPADIDLAGWQDDELPECGSLGGSDNVFDDGYAGSLTVCNTVELQAGIPGIEEDTTLKNKTGLLAG